jgi:hypothetical protein
MIPIKKIYLPLIIFWISSILLIVFIIWPLLRQISQVSQDFYLERNKIVYLNAEKENIQKIEKNYKAYESDLNKIGTLFFDPAVPIDFVNFLEKTATNSQVKLEVSSMTEKEQGDDSWPSLSLKVIISGSFSNASKFLEKIENSPYLIEIIDLNTMNLTKELADIPGADTNTALTIKVYTK